MNTATSLMVRMAPEPHYGFITVAPDQVPLPLAGFAQLRLEPPDDGHDPLQERAAHFMQVLVEVLSGQRPSRQLGGWMSHDVFEQLQRRLMADARSPRRQQINAGTRIGSVHVSMVSTDVAEIAARMVHGNRSRALAIRLELQTNLRRVSQWRCTALTWA